MEQIQLDSCTESAWPLDMKAIKRCAAVNCDLRFKWDHRVIAGKEASRAEKLILNTCNASLTVNKRI